MGDLYDMYNISINVLKKTKFSHMLNIFAMPRYDLSTLIFKAEYALFVYPSISVSFTICMQQASSIVICYSTFLESHLTRHTKS